MFGLMLKSTHFAVVRDMTDDLRKETQRANRNGSEVINLRAHVNRIEAELQPFLDRQEKAKQNLRQFKKTAAGAEAQKVRA